jgi:anti-sigma factor RsiW
LFKGKDGRAELEWTGGLQGVTMETTNMKCDEMGSKLADLLLDPESASAAVKAHVEACDNCCTELAELRATMNLLDEWKAPEPNPYFATKLGARYREEREAAPAGWLERLRARFAYGPQTHMRPIAAMALAVVLLLGGGAYVGLNMDQPAQPSPTAVVHDLQLMDSNADLLDQLEALSSSQQDGD